MFGAQHLIEGLRAVKNSFNSYPIDTLATMAAISAINDDSWFENNISNIIETRSYFHKNYKKLVFESCLPQPTCTGTHPFIEAGILREHLFNKKILVRHFPRTSVSNWLRITIGTKQDCDLLLSAVKQKISG